MPCDSRISIPLELDGARLEVLVEAMRRLGFQRSGEQMTWYKGGTLTVAAIAGHLTVVTRSLQEAEALKAQIRRETSKVIVEQAARKQGWALKWTAENRAEVARQTYGGR